SFVGELDLVVAAVAPTAASPRARSTSRATSALTRLIGCLPPGAIVKEPNQISLFWPIGGCQIRVLSLSGKYHFLDGSRTGRAAGDAAAPQTAQRARRPRGDPGRRPDLARGDRAQDGHLEADRLA